MKKRKVEIFSAGCPICQEVITTVRQIACDSCQIEVLDLNEPAVIRRARSLGVRSVPTVAVDGELAACCEHGGVDTGILKATGIGQPLN